MNWKVLESHLLIDNYHVTVIKNKAKIPDGAIIPDFYTVKIPDGAMIAALTTKGKVLLKREYRFACENEVIECPTGMFDKDETDPLVVATRELLEETGYISSDWTYLGFNFESTSKLTNKMHFFMAKKCKKMAEQLR